MLDSDLEPDERRELQARLDRVVEPADSADLRRLAADLRRLAVALREFLAAVGTLAQGAVLALTSAYARRYGRS